MLATNLMEWSEYYRLSLDKPLNPIFGRLEEVLPPSGKALDLGCGVGHGSGFLLEHGFTVRSIDADPEAVTITSSRFPPATVEQSTFQALNLPTNTYDCVIAIFSIFFLNAEEHGTFWPRLVDSMKSGCIFAGQFLGPDDDWRERGYATHDAAHLRRLLQGFDIHHWEEANRDGETIQGTPKHWHVFHVVAKKR